jgi:uncharacterized protein YecT (DUF1311 family)
MAKSGIVAVLLALILGVPVPGASAQVQPCPRGTPSNDACDQWHFEQADKELASVVELALAKIDSFAHPDTRQEAKERLHQAQRLWEQTREADCQAESAFMWLRSARTREGYTAACMHGLTVRRIAELRKRYLLPN